MTTPQPREMREPHAEAYQLAGEVLQRAVVGDLAGSAAAMQKVVDLRSMHAQLTMIYAITDTVIHYQRQVLIGAGVDPTPDHWAYPVWMEATEGAASLTRDADSVTPEVRWVGRFTTARARGDADMCIGLLESLDGGEQWTKAVCTLVEMAATTINSLTGAHQ